jgi:hypothetical protein
MGNHLRERQALPFRHVMPVGPVESAAVPLTPPPGYVTQSEDTSYEVELRLFERWRSMPLDEKAALIARTSRDLHTLCLAGLRQRLPMASERELELRAMALKYGKELVRRTLGVDVPDESSRIP